MKKMRLRLILAPVLTIFSIVALITLLYNFLVRSNVRDAVYDQVLTNIDDRANDFQNKVKAEYDFLNTITIDQIESLGYISNEHYTRIVSDFETEEPIVIDKKQDEVMIIFTVFKDDIWGKENRFSIYVPLYYFTDNVSFANNFIEEYFVVDDGLLVLHTTGEKKEFLYSYFGDNLISNTSHIEKIYNNKTVLFEAGYLGVNKTYYSTEINLNEDIKLYFVATIDTFASNNLVSLLNVMTMVLIITTTVTMGVGIYLLIKNNQDYSKEMMMALKKVNGTTSYVIITDLSGNIKDYNLFVKDDFKFINEAKTIKDLVDRRDLIPEQLNYLKGLDTGVMLNRGRRFFHFFVTCTKNKACFIGEDVTDAHDENERLKRIALIHPVTKRNNLAALQYDIDNMLLNRKLLVNSFLIAIDMEHFRSINKVFGRKIGDMVLNKVANMIEEQFDTDKITFYHSDADNFYILGHNFSSPREYISELVLNLNEEFKEPLHILNNVIGISLRYGVYLFDEDSVMTQLIIENADSALKACKSSRTTNFLYYDVNIGLQISKDSQMLNDLRRAIKNKEFVLYYQPQFDLFQKRICGFEALIRWANPKYITESPLKFIEIAEKNDMIGEIGKFVLEAGIIAAKKFERNNIKISVNVSPAQLMQSGFVGEVLSLVEKYKAKPKNLVIEITETVMMELYDDVFDKLKMLQSYGFEIHLDDFGTGYSSLLYLNKLPVNAIKIDRGFIIDLDETTTQQIVSKVIQMANALDLDIIAEGVEDKKQSNFIERAGGNIIQGYLISKPVPEEQVEALLAKYNKDDASKLD